MLKLSTPAGDKTKPNFQMLSRLPLTLKCIFICILDVFRLRNYTTFVLNLNLERSCEFDGVCPIELMTSNDAARSR